MFVTAVSIDDIWSIIKGDSVNYICAHCDNDTKTATNDEKNNKYKREQQKPEHSIK